MAEGSFECRVSGKRESANGIFLTLQIQPDDHDAALAMLRVGAALQIGWAEIVDTAVQRIEIGSPEHKAAQKTVNDGYRAALDKIAPKRKFEELPLSSQAALRCNDEQFKWFLMDEFPTVVSHEHDPANVVRYICGVKSRANFDTDEIRGAHWISLETSYQQWLTDKNYKDLVR